MKFTTKAGDLLAAVGAAAGATNPKKPVLACVRLTATGDSVKVEASDGEVWLTATVPAAIKVAGACLVSAERLEKILKEAGSSDDLSAAVDDKRLASLTVAGDKHKLTGMNPAEFPDMTPIGMSTAVSAVTTGAEFRRLHALTKFAAGKEGEQIRSTVFYGTHIEIEPGLIHFTCADSLKLASASTSATGCRPEGRVAGIVPAKGMKLAAAAFADGDEVKVSIGPAAAVFESATATVGTPLVSGRFLDWRKHFLATKPAVKFPLPAGLFAGLIRRATPIGPYRLSFAFTPDGVSVTARNEHGESEVEMPLAGYTGKPLALDIAADQLPDALKAASDLPDLTLEMTSKIHPVSIRSGDSFRFFAMPLSEAETGSAATEAGK